MGPLNGTGRPIRLLKADEVGRRVFNWGIVSRFAEPSQGWDLLLPHATFVGSSEFASSGQARLLALLAGPMVLGISARPLHGAHRERPPSTPRFPRWDPWPFIAVPRPGPFLKTQCEGTPDSLRPPARHGDSLDGRQLRHPHRLLTLARRPNACRWLCPCCRTLRSDQDALGQERRFRRVLGRRLKPTPRPLMTPWPLPEARWRTSVPR